MPELPGVSSPKAGGALPKLDGLFEAVVEDGRRAGASFRGIRGMIHKGKEVRDTTDLNKIVAAVLRLVHSEALERHCVLVTELDPKLPLVETDRMQAPTSAAQPARRWK